MHNYMYDATSALLLLGNFEGQICPQLDVQGEAIVSDIIQDIR